MCLVVHRDTQKKIAEEDIIVYKELRHIYENVVSACYQDFNYILEKLYKTEITKETPNEVIHTCFDCKDAEVLMKAYGDSWRINEDLISYAQGFHSAMSQDRFKELSYYNSSIYECVIPKGSEYYENLSGLIVSNQIIIKNKI